MNNEQQTWILKPGIDLRIVDLKDGLSFVHYVDDYVQWETEHVNALFMKLDVAGLTRQVEELVVRGLARSANREKIRQNAPTGTPLLEKRAYELYGEPVTDTIEMVEAILELLLNQEKEQ